MIHETWVIALDCGLYVGQRDPSAGHPRGYGDGNTLVVDTDDVPIRIAE